MKFTCTLTATVTLVVDVEAATVPEAEAQAEALYHRHAWTEELYVDVRDADPQRPNKTPEDF